MVTYPTFEGLENHTIVSRERWLVARRELLKKEKELTRLRDEMSARRRELPWVRVEKNYYNYERLKDGTGCEELPGFSVFYRNTAGNVFHTYSGYARAGDILIGAYNYLDHIPKGRNERQNMDWVRHHDCYELQFAAS